MSVHQRSDHKWYFRDEIGDLWGPYRSQQKAEQTLTGYLYHLDYGPTPWQTFWWPIRYGIKRKFMQWWTNDPTYGLTRTVGEGTYEIWPVRETPPSEQPPKEEIANAV